MKIKLVLSTHNAHKSEEVKSILGDNIEVCCLNDLGIYEDIPETGVTLQENAMQKASYVYDRLHENCFADDTGLEVEALGGAPGVYSARYAGEGHNSEDNIRKLLHEMDGVTNRKAQFRTVIALIYDDKSYCFEGIVTGLISMEPRGVNGFGYDSVFIPDGYDKTFAELEADIKNKISHRYRALEKLNAFFEERMK